ncbi:unnamed protein product [Adineta ricciae]|uniref:Uncharacterized protein n=1 Tax=Adineta ricciae TaxID=249248 RepID=A0A815CZG8_ADIRI|nr:unnamed protein product [Adineta ricciae]
MTYFLIAGSITLTLLVLLILTIAYYTYNLRKNNIFRRLGMPGPEPIPFIGEAYNIIRKGLIQNDIDLIQKYGKIVGIVGGKAPNILLSDPDLLRNVLIKDSNMFINRRAFEGISGPLEHGLLALKDELWKNARSIVSPTFSTAKLKAMYSLMNEISDTYCERFLEYADKQEIIDMKALNSQFTLDNIASCLFGIETNSLQNENITLVNYLKKFFNRGLSNTILFVYFISPRLATYFGKKGYSMFPKDAVDYTTNLLNQILAQRRQHLERRNDFIQMMIDHEEEINHEVNQQTHKKEEQQQWGTLKKTLNDKEILSQAVVFLLAGYETTSILMTCFFYIMTTEPAIQEKVYEEIRQEIGDDEVTHEKLNQLPYLDMVISETLRRYPPGIRFDRIAAYDYQLGDYQIPKGTIVNVSVYPIHHDPDVWPDPEKFIPERQIFKSLAIVVFLPAEKAKRHPMTYLPFGDGPRNCIGMRFALLEAKVGIVKALRAVEFQKCEKTAVPLELGKFEIINSKIGVWVRVVRRSQ